MVIVCDEDIKEMYKRYLNGEITLWCDGIAQEVAILSKCKRKREESSKFQEREEVDTIFKELQKKHAEKYDIPKLRLWARMISNNLHESMEQPPSIPAFGCPQKKARHDTFSNVLNGAAVAFAQAMSGTGKVPDRENCAVSATAMQVDLRMKNLQQL